MNKNIIYSDGRVDVYENGIQLKKYYFPTSKAKFVKFSDILTIEKKQPTLMNGKWRCWGSGDFFTWFPLDWKRPARNAIFFLCLATQKIRIGFTVESTESFVKALESKGNKIENP
jgi:hypothetical protein